MNNSSNLKVFDYRLGYSAFLSGDFEQAEKYLTSSAEAGVAFSQYLLGSIYFDEKEIGEYTQTERDLLKKSADLLKGGDLAKKMLNKGARFRNPQKAIMWYTLAAQSGLCAAQFALAICYQGGNGVRQDFEKAIYWTRLAAQHGHDDDKNLTENQLTRYFSDGTMNIDQNAKEVIIGEQSIASIDSVSQAQCNLAIYYITGMGVARNYNEALTWLKKAAANDYVPAIFLLGQLYDDGGPFDKRFNVAFEYYLRAAKLGHAEAQHCVGCCYFNGQGVAAAKDKAISWWKQAADNGNVKAQYNLGLCYYSGEGVAKNEVEAVKWLKLASDNGLPEAKCLLGICYQTGLIPGKGVVDSKSLFEQAANTGVAEAQFRLGIYYHEYGSIQESVIWLRKAAAAGHTRAKIALDELLG